METVNVNDLIQQHSTIIAQIEKLEDEKHALSEKILEETKDFNREQLLEIYPKIKDSHVKYQLFLKIKNG